MDPGQGQQQPGQSLGGVGPVSGLPGVGGPAVEEDGVAHAGALGHPVDEHHAALGEAAPVVEGIDAGDARLPDQCRADSAARADLLSVLEDEIDIFLRSLLVDLHGQQGQSGTVTIVAAAVGDSGGLGGVGEVRLLRHG